MVRPPRLRRSHAAVACTATLVLGGVPTAAASAVTTPAASTRFATQVTTVSAAYMSPAIDCGYDFVEFVHNKSVIGVCSLDGVTLHAGSDYPVPLSAIINHSQDRLWLHQNADGTGWSHCVSGQTSVTLPEVYENPGNIFISANTAAC